MRKTLTIVCLTVLCLLMAVTDARAAALPDVLAAGSGRAMFVLVQSADKFQLLYRNPALPKDSLYVALESKGKVIGMAAAGSRAFLLYEGQFIQSIRYLNPIDPTLDKFSTDQLPPLPADSSVIDMVGGNEGLYVLAMAPPAPPVSDDSDGADDAFTSKYGLNRPPNDESARQSTGTDEPGADAKPADKPADAPAKADAPADATPHLTLFHYKQGQWQRMDGPRSLDGQPHLRLALAGSHPVVLHFDQGKLALERYDGKAWEATSFDMKIASDYQAVTVDGHLLIVDRTPNDAGDGMRLRARLLFEGRWLDAGEMDLPPGRRVDGLATGYGDQLTVVIATAADESGRAATDAMGVKLAWRQRDLDNPPDTAAKTGPLNIVQWPSPPVSREMLTFAMIAVSMLIIMAVWRRDPKANAIQLPAGVVPAEISRRAMALLIDLLPAWGALYLIFGLTDSERVLQHLLVSYGDWSQMMISLLVVLMMTVHVTLSEMFAGRSLGKWIMRIRVVSIRGEHPNVWQVLVRNAIRVLELPPLIWMLSLVVVLNPAHQRLGDMAGRTVVVRDARPGERFTNAKPPANGE